MSIFNDLLPEIRDISKNYVKNIEDDLQKSLDALEKFGEEYKAGRGRGRDTLRGKNALKTLQIINEDEGETNKNAESADMASRPSSRNSKKRSRDMIEGPKSPEQDKRIKRNASTKAQDVISKQVNINLSKKLRRDASMEGKRESRGRKKRGKNDNKENVIPLPIPVVDIKSERISMPEEEVVEQEAIPHEIVVKQEVNKDVISMPPPMAPVPKARKGKVTQEESQREASESGVRRSTRNRKQTDTLPQQPVSTRSTRNSRLTSAENPEEEAKTTDSRPKHTRNKKKQVEQTEQDKDVALEKQTETVLADSTTSPQQQENSRPKRTRKQPTKLRDMVTVEHRAKADHGNAEKPERDEDTEAKSPILVPKQKSPERPTAETIEPARVDGTASARETATITDVPALNGTIILTNSVFDHAPETPKAVNMNETVTLQSRSTFIYDTQVVNETNVLAKEPSNNMTEDESIMTEDNSDLQETPPKIQAEPANNPPSAVKERVQQFEEIASRVTRTKTRAVVDKTDEEDKQTPPDRIGVPAKTTLSADTLNKMNKLIFNGKTNQISASASKAIPVQITNSKLTSSTTKVSAIAKLREREEELKREKEDARKKKEAMLEAKKEMQKRKREEKMAAAAAARSAAEKERLAQIQLAEKERQEKLAHQQQGRLEKQKEQERKKQELARKVAETEERRKAEEQARALRLAEEQKKADILRKRQQEEAEAMKKEAMRMAKEMEKRQKEYNEKQKMKQKLESDKVTTPLRNALDSTINNYKPASPVYMEDGFQYLNSDEDDDQKPFPVPHWSQSKIRWKQLSIQGSIRSVHVDRLFSVRQHSVDLKALFPNIDRRALKRTSSAVWRSPRRPN